MFLRSSLLSLLATAASFNLVAASLDPITIKGTKFFFSGNGSQFYIKGVAYQQDVGAGGDVGSSTTFIDPLASASNCKRDIPYLKKLGTNLIRVYAIDPTADHSACMQMLDDAGIYVLADLGSPAVSINRASPVWDTTLFARYTQVVDALQNYTNVMGFFAGNEVTNNLTNTEASAYVKAAVRDTKAYIAAKGYHHMGVGYAADDDATVRDQVADFMNCGDSADSIDFWGYNIYEWCGHSTFTTSGYSQRVEEFANYTVPAFFAEYGCNTPNGGDTSDGAARPWEEVGTLFSSKMTDVFSGGIAYEYFEEVNDFGLVSVASGGSVNTLADFNSLSSQIASVTPTTVASSTYTPTNTVPRDCPSLQTGYWQATSSPLPPSPNSQLCSCMLEGLSCTTKAGITDAAVGELLNYICSPDVEDGKDLCGGIASNATTGVYGAYSMCTGAQKLAFVINNYYNAQSTANKATACDFNGNATIHTSQKPSGTCGALISQAGSAGTGTVTTVPTSASSGTSSAGSASSSTSKAAAAGNFVPGLGSGWSTLVGLAVYTFGAFAIGASMVWL